MTIRMQFSRTKTPDSIRKHHLFTLTPVGKRKVAEFEGEGAKFSVMATLSG